VIQVGIYPTRSEAELAQAALAVAGIPSLLAADDAGGARLLVEEADAEGAQAVLSEGSDPEGV
jgi:cell division protein FtsN